MPPYLAIKGSIDFLDEINDKSIHIYFVGDKPKILSLGLSSQNLRNKSQLFMDSRRNQI